MNMYETAKLRLQAQLEYHERMLEASKGKDRVFHSKQACSTQDALDSLEIRYNTLLAYAGKKRNAS